MTAEVGATCSVTGAGAALVSSGAKETYSITGIRLCEGAGRDVFDHRRRRCTR